jgi:NAD(P)-dependent dehydrogenase (short-subunit alcohol dehydrogenase family)
MDLRDAVAVVTGGGNGIGAALASRLTEARVRGVVVSDLDGEAAAAVAAKLNAAGGRALAVPADASDKADLKQVVDTAIREFGAVDLFCSNAGIAFGTGIQAAADQWDRSWRLNVLQHVFAAQIVLPAMVRRKTGHLLITASAAGLLGVPGDAPYSVTKSATVGLAEWLATTYKPRGIGVSVLCPLGVRTNFLLPGIAVGHPAARAIFAAGELLSAEAVADTAVLGVEQGKFMILPHASVADSYASKATEPERWIARAARGATEGVRDAIPPARS